MDITKECPDLNYFRVIAVGGIHRGKMSYLVATLEESLGLLSLARINQDHTKEINPLNKFKENEYINSYFSRFGICLAETSMYYKPSDIDKLQEDYFISKIVGLFQ